METANVQLIEPVESLRDEYEAYAREFSEESGAVIQGSGGMGTSSEFAAGVRACRDHAKGVNLPEGWVPAHTFWLVRDGRTMIGTVNIRHRLTPFLDAEGGHIGYSVRPTERRKGYATRMLALALEKARQIGLRRVLITCDRRNVASARVIQKNGGVFENEVPSGLPGREWTRRYWVEL